MCFVWGGGGGGGGPWASLRRRWHRPGGDIRNGHAKARIARRTLNRGEASPSGLQETPHPSPALQAIGTWAGLRHPLTSQYPSVLVFLSDKQPLNPMTTVVDSYILESHLVIVPFLMRCFVQRQPTYAQSQRCSKTVCACPSLSPAGL